MKPFKLEAVLEHRKQIEAGALKDLLACQEVINMLNQAIGQEESEVVTLCDGLEKAKIRDVIVSDLILYERCICQKKKQVRELEQKIAEIGGQLARKRKALVKARQERRVLEIVRDKREDTERKKQKRLEDTFMDEVSVLCFGGSK